MLVLFATFHNNMYKIIILRLYSYRNQGCGVGQGQMHRSMGQIRESRKRPMWIHPRDLTEEQRLDRSRQLVLKALGCSQPKKKKTFKLKLTSYTKFKTDHRLTQKMLSYKTFFKNRRSSGSRARQRISRLNIKTLICKRKNWKWISLKF